MVWGQQIHPTVTPDLPPPPTMNPGTVNLYSYSHVAKYASLISG